MSQKKNIAWLHRQLPLWLENNLLGKAQADSIASFYPPLSNANLGRQVFSSIGAILIGLGIILFFAYNWQEMHRLLKIVIIFAVFGLSNAGALWFHEKNGAASESLAILGTLLFGAAIWLLSQIYHIDEHYPNAFLFWGLAALAMAWARQSRLQCLATLVLLSTWACLEMFYFHRPTYIAPWLVLLGAGGLALRIGSPWLVFISLSLFYFLWVLSLVKPLDDGIGYLILALSLLFVSLGIVSERPLNQRWSTLRLALLIPGFIVYLAIVYGLTFVHFSNDVWHLRPFDSPLQSFFFWGSLLVCLIAPSTFYWPFPNCRKVSETDAIHGALMLTTAVLVYGVGTGSITLSYGTLSGLMNLIFIGHCLLFILHGSRIQRGWEVSIGCLLFALLMFSRYSDLFDSLLSRAAVFLVLGAALFVVGNFYSRHKASGSAPLSGEGFQSKEAAQ